MFACPTYAAFVSCTYLCVEPHPLLPFFTLSTACLLYVQVRSSGDGYAMPLARF
eukprot:m.165023 g.165023  ORF g.165023 m.165023 type:complete len:54 (-) comp14416_c0_seq2:124-285(-)